MAKTRVALGAGIKHSEPFGTGRSEPFGIPSSETFGTERGGERRLEAAAAIAGRPPVLSDDQLLDLARRLNTDLGRPPKTEELIAQAGGCQRKRALHALQALRLEIAQRSVRSQLLFPPSIEAQLRSVMAEWLGLAAEHLAQRQAEFVEQIDERVDAANAHVEELQARVGELQAQLEESRKAQSQALGTVQGLTAERDQLRRALDAAQAVAAERQRVIDQLVLGPATQSPGASSEARS